jgi:tetratricopeptide (TPR) repeat protein
MEALHEVLTEVPAAPPILRATPGRTLILCLLLALATIALYNAVTHAPFLNYDDPAYVRDNLHVRAGITWNTISWAFRTTELSDWKPITWLSHALDCQMFGLNPSGPHIVNVLFHALNAVLLFLILQSATGFTWRSLMVASLFALHPINVESVAWIAERKNVLSMFFFLLALAAYGWYARKGGVWRYLAVTVAYALGLMAKAQVITFPFALLLLDYWPLYRIGSGDEPRDGISEGTAESKPQSPAWSLIVEKLPWIGLSAASAVITLKAEADATELKLPFWAHVGNAIVSYVKYLEKAIWPANLALVYPHPELSLSRVAVALSALLLILLTVLVVIGYRRRPIFVVWFWFLGTWVPLIGLVQIGVHAMADRYAYIPFMGIFVIVCWGCAELANAWRVPRSALAAASGLLLLLLAFGLHRQVSFWTDNLTIWSHALEITEGNYIAEDNVATALIDEGRLEEAIPYLRRAHMLNPDDPLSTTNLATFDQMRGNYRAAIDGYANVIRNTTVPFMLANARVNSGYAHYSLKEYDSARLDFEGALHAQPQNWSAYRGLGLVAQRAGDVPKAAEEYRISVQLLPSPVGYLLLAQALERSGQADRAHAAEAAAAQMSRDFNDDVATVRQLLSN